MIASRTTTRPVTVADLPQIEPWYRGAAAAVLGLPAVPDDDSLKRRFDESNGRLLLMTRHDDTNPIGLLDYRINHPASGWLTVTFLAVVPALRGRGHGSEAVRRLESTQPMAHYVAEVAPRNGLGVYFWLRVGYHPAHTSEVFWRPPDEGGTMAMIRHA